MLKDREYKFWMELDIKNKFTWQIQHRENVPVLEEDIMSIVEEKNILVIMAEEKSCTLLSLTRLSMSLSIHFFYWRKL